MRDQQKGRPSPAMIVACIALAVALGGAAYAASLPRNSVGSAQIKKNAVKGKHIAKSTVPRGDLKGSARVPKVVVRTFVANTAGNGTLGEAEANCNTGETLIGGGGGWVNNLVPPTQYSLSGEVSDSSPSLGDAPIADGAQPTAWHVAGRNQTGANARMMAYALCAQT